MNIDELLEKAMLFWVTFEDEAQLHSWRKYRQSGHD